MSLITHQKTLPSLVEIVCPQISRREEITLIVTGSWLIALAAQITIPLWPVPITGQTFGILLIGALLGSRRGAWTVMVYLAQGAIGLPVFAGGTGGLARLFSPTGGYLVGFVAAAFVVGWLSERGWHRRFVTTSISMLIGNVVIYAFGLAWLAAFLGWSGSTVLKAGLFPFVIGDLLKVLLAALALPRVWAMVNTKTV